MTEYNSDELLRLLQGVEPDSDFDVEWESTSEEDDNEHELDTLLPARNYDARSNKSNTVQQEQWSSTPYNPKIEPFDDFASGLNIHFNNGNFIQLDIFQHFLHNELVTQIITCINQYHNYFLLNVPLSAHSRLHRWHDITVPEFYIFISIVMLMSRNKHLTIEEHWSTDPLLLSPIFGSLMPRNRFVNILVVVTLIQDFFGSYRHLYIDNWYTSPKLLRYLHENNIYACGTVKKNRAGMPSMTQKLKRGEIISKSLPPLTAI
ncbi:hypothetical protein HW555_009988, partial [Spodoptera exigua]